MKKIYAILFAALLCFATNNSFSQVNSVGLNGSFVHSSIADAYTAIGGSISSPQLIELSSSYTGSSEVAPVSLTPKSGSSSSNTITIRPSAGANGLTLSKGSTTYIFRFDSCKYVIVDGRPGGVTSTSANYLNVENTTTGGNSGAAGFFGGSNCNYQYTNSTGVAASTGARMINLAGTATSQSNNNIVQYNRVRGGLRGIQDFGFNTTSINLSNIIRNNDIAQFFNIGMLLSNNIGLLVQSNRIHFTSAITTVASFLTGIQIQGTSTTIDQNEIDSITSLNCTSYSLIANFGANNVITNNNLHDPVISSVTTQITGVQFSGTSTTTFSGNSIYNLKGSSATVFVIALSFASNGAAADVTTVSGNKIYNLSSDAAVNVRGMSCFPRPGNTVNIQNNFVSITETNSLSTAIFGILVGTSTGAYNANVYNNSVLLGGVGSNVSGFNAALYIDSVSPTSVINSYNNIATNNRTGPATAFNIGYDITAYPQSTVTFNSNNNMAESADTTGWDAGFAGSIFRNAGGLELYYSAACAYGVEQLSEFASVPFVSNTDLHLAGPIGINMAAKNLAAVTTDIDGTSRAITGTNPFTYKGADEVLPTGGATWRKSVINITVSLQNSFPASNTISGGITNSTGSLDLYAPMYISGTAPVYTGSLYCGDIITSTGQYYLNISSINSIYTFSGAVQTFPAVSNSYNFTTSLSQAFGSNMDGVAAPYAIFQGDVNQDETIDAGDLASVENDAGIGPVGCRIITDVNFDETTDAADLAIVENNSGLGVVAILPFAPAPSSTQRVSTEKSSKVNNSFNKATENFNNNNVSLSN